MSGLVREAPDRFRIRFDELGAAGGLLRSLRRPAAAAVHVDPFMIGRAVAEVMKACAFRSASGRRLLWNDYRVILARADFELLRGLEVTIERDLHQALRRDAKGLDADMVGDLRVTIVFDDADELPAGEAVVRAQFVPSDRFAAPRAGELTVQFDTRVISGEIRSDAVLGGTETVMVADAPPPSPYRVRWPGGEAPLPRDATVVLGRPHPDAPPGFIALGGASPRINKQQLSVQVTGDRVRIGRISGANPVHVAGQPVASGKDHVASPPLEIALSNGELVLTIEKV